jgi:hypothetical protein
MRSSTRILPLGALLATLLVGSTLLSPLAGASVVASNRPVPYSVRLEDQMLANLRYLPVAFQASLATSVTTTTTSTTSTTTTTLSTATTTTTLAPPTTTTTLAPPTTTTTLGNPTVIHKGSFAWRYSVLPAALKSQWSVGTDNVVLKGALMRFQSVHNLPTTGQMDATTWHTLVSAARRNQVDPNPYTYVYVSQTQPETLTLYIDNYVFFTSAVNTGISVAPTANGTFPVYLRYAVTTMSGKNPNGKPYHDTGIPWTSYFNGGDALHGFIRGSYGYPQSLGCVEMTFAHAAIVWPHTPIGTLVTVAQ